MAQMVDEGPDFDVIVVGAGFSGLYMLYRLRELGFKVKVLEAGDGVGGTWHWNRYPGARCDVPSLAYSFGFDPDLEQEWQWTEKYPPQPEILAYLNHVADRFDLRRDIQLETRVVGARFEDADEMWSLETETGETMRSRFCVMATGALSIPKNPEFPGADTFAGESYVTSEWPAEGVDFAGKRVGVIGTGSTGIQVIPQVARQAERLTVFQRTPNFSVPAQNTPLDPELEAKTKAEYQDYRRRQHDSIFGVPTPVGEKSALAVDEDELTENLERIWANGSPSEFLLSYTDLGLDADANERVAEFVRRKIRETVKDPEVAEMLCPDDHPIGTKRICVDIDYFETYNRDNVSLVDVRADPIVEITPTGIRTGGSSYDLDVIVYAIGFDAMTGALLSIDPIGRDGVRLAAAWKDGPRSFLGLGVAGFPNLFTVTGPMSPSVLSNMVVSIEQHINWIANCIAYLRDHDLTEIDPDPDAQEKWVEHVRTIADSTLYPQADSWYVGANVPGKPRVFMPYVGGVNIYDAEIRRIAEEGYPGFKLSGPRELARSDA